VPQQPPEVIMRRQLNTHPIRTLAGLLAVAFVLFMISGIPAIKRAHGWTLADVVGFFAWFGFLLVFLTFVICAAYVAIRRVRGLSPRTTA
jgi:hypothetical protein